MRAKKGGYIIRLLKLAGKSVRNFYRDGGIHLSAAIAFFSLFSLIPLLFLLVTIFAYILGTYKGVYVLTLSYLKTIFPHIDQALIEELHRIISNKKLGQVSILIFLWLATLVFSALEYAINTIFKTPKRRHFLFSTLLSLFMVFVSMTLILVSFGIASIAKLLERYPLTIAEVDLTKLLVHNLAIQFLLPFFLIALVFIWVYKFLPQRRISWGHATLGGLLTAFFWELAKHFYAWYLGKVTFMGTIYGSLAAIIVLMLWVFYSAVVLLLGAELVFLLSQGD